MRALAEGDFRALRIAGLVASIIQPPICHEVMSSRLAMRRRSALARGSLPLG
jgi:hypothetical protein